LLAPGLIDSALKLQLLLLFCRHPRLCGEMWSLSEWLVTAYDDPQQRDQIHALIHAADQERRFRAWLVAEEGRVGAYVLVVRDLVPGYLGHRRQSRHCPLSAEQ
jgi:hypothetical protein